MKSKITMFAVPVVGLLIGALTLPAGAQSYYEKSITSYDEPNYIERVEEPMPMQFDKEVTIERPVVIDNTLPATLPAEPPVIIEENRHPHHLFHAGLFPVGDLNLF